MREMTNMDLKQISNIETSFRSHFHACNGSKTTLVFLLVHGEGSLLATPKTVGTMQTENTFFFFMMVPDWVWKLPILFIPNRCVDLLKSAPNNIIVWFILNQNNRKKGKCNLSRCTRRLN